MLSHLQALALRPALTAGHNALALQATRNARRVLRRRFQRDTRASPYPLPTHASDIPEDLLPALHGMIRSGSILRNDGGTVRLRE